MALGPNLSTILLLLTVLIVLLPAETYAFGAGAIPGFAFLNDKAFRHGDIESVLQDLVKDATVAGGLVGFLMQRTNRTGPKFTKSDVKKVYFGNWLRDYSQALDIAGLTKLTPETLVLIVSVLGFMTFGFATAEFEVTADRLGVYLPVEHIDNPKGYGADVDDPRQLHPSLRPPVDERELEIDERTGMKGYMATEDQGWDSSTAFIKRTFRTCIEIGRRARGRNGKDLWEAYRLLGTGLHTMEDLLAHSNWCEVALRKLGYEEVFCHVGDNVTVNTPSGPAPPLITGTFGGADFIHSLMGEATDKLSQASVTDLSKKMSLASEETDDQPSNVAKLKALLSRLPFGGSDDTVKQTDEMAEQAKAYHFDPDNIAPPEVQQQLLALLKWRDQVYMGIARAMDMVPGLNQLLDDVSDSLNGFVYTIMSPYVAPMLQQATGILDEGSKVIIDSEDQFEVFDNPDASDPTHSFLSKDHFNLILNEPAGKIAQLIVEHTVNLIVQAWADDSNPDLVIDQILEAFHHPYYATGDSNIQNLMFDHMITWITELGEEGAQEVIQRLNKDSVRRGLNRRPGSEDEPQEENGYCGHGHSHGSSSFMPTAGYDYEGPQSRGFDTDGSGDSYRSSGQYGYARYGSGDQEDLDHFSPNLEYLQGNTDDDSQTEFQGTNEGSPPSSDESSVSSADSDEEEEGKEEDEAAEERIDPNEEDDSSYYPDTRAYAPSYYRPPRGDEDRVAYGYAPRYYY